MIDSLSDILFTAFGGEKSRDNNKRTPLHTQPALGCIDVDSQILCLALPLSAHLPFLTCGKVRPLPPSLAPLSLSL